MNTGNVARSYRADRPMRTLYRSLDCRWWQLCAIQVTLALKALPAYLAPVFLAEVVRVLSMDVPDTDYLTYICIGFAALLFVNPPLTILATKLASARIRTLELSLRSAVVHHLQKLSMKFHAEHSVGMLHAKVLRDVQAVLLMTMQILYKGFHTLIGLAIALVIVAFSDWRILILFILTVPPILILTYVFSGKMKENNKGYRYTIESMSARIGEMLNLIPVTRAHGLEGHELAVVERHLGEVYSSGTKVDVVNAIFVSYGWMVMQLFGLALIAGSAALIVGGYMSTDKMLLYHGLFWMTLHNVQSLLDMVPTLTQGFESMDSLGDVLECDDLEDRGKRKLTTVTGAVCFDQVCFSYKDQERPAVQNFNLEVRPGECIAFVGESGSGKSTLMNLLIGFWRPQQGEIRLEGCAQSELDMRSWRKHVAVVPQQTVLFGGSIRENISYGMESIDDAAIEAAVDAAQLRRVVDDMPDGLDTLIGEDGVKLSGGQRQRIAIARAIARNPRVIILDEATSALDVASERAVQQALEALIKGRTTFIVAHRLTTIRKADRVVVMDRGHCIESGQREALLRDESSVFAGLELACQT